MSYIGNESYVVDLSSADQALATPINFVLAGVKIKTSNSAEVSLTNGSGGTELDIVEVNSQGWVELGDNRYGAGVYVDAGGAATGVIVIRGHAYKTGQF